MVVAGLIIAGLIIIWGLGTSIFTDEDPVETLLLTISGLLFTGVGTLALCLFGWIFTSDIDGHETRYELKALNVSSGTSGTFFLGIGGFGEDATFYAYVGEDGAYRLYNFDADNVEIYEKAGTPYLVADCGSDEADTWVTWPVATNTNKPDCNLEHENIEFYVPPGSIMSEIDLTIPGSEN